MKVRYPGPHDAVEFAIPSGTTETIAVVERNGVVDVPESLGVQLVAQGWRAVGKAAKDAVLDAAAATEGDDEVENEQTPASNNAAEGD